MADKREHAADSEPVSRLLPEWKRHLVATNKAPRTIEAYLASGQAFDSWLTSENHQTGAADITPAVIEQYLAAGFDRGLSASTVHREYRHLRQFFRWLVMDEAVPVSPFERLRPPAVPETLVPIITPEQQRALLATVTGRDFASRRDNALIRLFLDSGARLAEVTGMTLDDLDLEHDIAHVLGKGRRPRVVAFGNTTHQALRKYRMERAKHPRADDPALWLGRLGPLTRSGVQQVIERRSKEAGIGAVHPHQLRHTFAHEYLQAGGNESDLMMLAGWRSREMVGRYGKSAAAERAIAAHHGLGIGDQR